jgi:signal transduction histidine kinase
VNQNEVQQAFAEYDRQNRISNSKLGAVLAIIMMPLGASLDYFVYYRNRPDGAELLRRFFELRVLCSLLVGVVLALFWTNFGKKHYRVLGMTWYMLPAFFIAWMIYAANDPVSPYYAGLNLVVLAIGLILPWTYKENLLAVALVISMYLGACLLQRSTLNTAYVFNNVYFLLLTGVVVVASSFAASRLRFREFQLRYELNASRQEIEKSHKKLVELDQAKGRFFANISHELRTPLTLLISPLETLLHQYKWDEQTKMLLTTMQSNGMRLLKLINDLLDLVRLESGTIVIKLEPMNVDDFIKGEASSARSVAEDKRIRLETLVDPALGTLMADRDKLEKIVLNLVFNALKFTPAGGRVDLRAQKQGEEFVIIVSDTGMGISAANLANVFSRFWQADDTSRRKYQGVGIGLALVKELSIAHGGDVSVASEQGQGTTFTVRLPYNKAQQEPPAKTEEAPKPQPTAQPAGTVSSQEWLANLYRRAELFPSMTSLQETLRQVETAYNGNNMPTLLVADDEPDMLRYLKSQLATHYRVVEAVDGQQAIEKASQFLPDIILLDMMMPEKDGLQACREIRQRTSTQSIPVILLTARADEETKMAALSAGASDFLTKPFSTTELHVRIKNLVESHQYQIKLSKQKTVLEHTIEQLKETETQLVQTEKLASLGRMSAGIIHEINNPLNFATTGLFTLRNKGKQLAPEQQQEYQEVLQDVEDGLKRVKSIVSELRTFTHPDIEGRDQVEVSEIVSSALRFLSNEWKDKVEIEQSLTEHQTIWANKSKLVQVLVNLLQNSLDALKSKVFENEKPTVRIEGFVEKNKSILRVRDNGTGIDPKNLDKIFDPFFTTKDVGEGMGLGLSICYRIVEECDGRISVKTEPGKFCEFTLEFPAKG